MDTQSSCHMLSLKLSCQQSCTTSLAGQVFSLPLIPFVPLFSHPPTSTSLQCMRGLLALSWCRADKLAPVPDSQAKRSFHFHTLTLFVFFHASFLL
jgi:hypothetical protein